MRTVLAVNLLGFLLKNNMGHNNHIAYTYQLVSRFYLTGEWGKPSSSSSQKFAYWPFPHQKNCLQQTNQITIFKQPNKKTSSHFCINFSFICIHVMLIFKISIFREYCFWHHRRVSMFLHPVLPIETPQRNFQFPSPPPSLSLSTVFFKIKTSVGTIFSVQFG